MQLQASTRRCTVASVLLVDQSLFARTRLRTLLSNAGHHVIGEALDRSGRAAAAAELAPRPARARHGGVLRAIRTLRAELVAAIATLPAAGANGEPRALLGGSCVNVSSGVRRSAAT
jgi:hypothetical protein